MKRQSVKIESCASASKNGSERSAVFCMLPWVGMNNQANGGFFPCQYWSRPPESAAMGQDSPAKLPNAEPLKKLRRDMLAAQPSAGCSYCYDNEREGLLSLRKWANQKFAGDLDLVESTQADGGLPRPRFRYLSLAFSNLCNLRCRTCYPQYSTAWYREAEILLRERHGNISKRIPSTPAAAPVDFLRSLEPYLADIQLIRFVGGEPLLAKEHYDLLERLLELKLNRVKLRCNTNLSVLRHRGREVTDLWNRFEDVEVAVSFDATERRGDYLRKGQRWEEAVENWRRVRRDCPRVRFVVAPTVSLFNVLHLPDFHREWIDERLIEPDAFNLHVLKEPLHYSIQALPRRIKERAAEKYRKHIKEYLLPADPASPDAGNLIQSVLKFTMMLNYMHAADLSGELENFKKATSDLDRLRGEKFVDVFPELSELFQPHPETPSAASPRVRDVLLERLLHGSDRLSDWGFDLPAGGAS